MVALGVELSAQRKNSFPWLSKSPILDACCDRCHGSAGIKFRGRRVASISDGSYDRPCSHPCRLSVVGREELEAVLARCSKCLVITGMLLSEHVQLSNLTVLDRRCPRVGLMCIAI